MVYVIKLVFFSLILDRLGLEWFYVCYIINLIN